MLLSIVETGDHRQTVAHSESAIPQLRYSERVEKIGPVFRANASAMRNAGARVAKGRWIFFKDRDCELSERDIIRLLNIVSTSPSEIKVMGGLYRNTGSQFLGHVYNFVQNHWVLSGVGKTKAKDLRAADRLLGGALLIERATYERLGGFSEAIGWGAEELEFLNRAHHHGCGVALIDDLYVTHKNRLSVPGFFKRAWVQNFNRGFYRLSRSTQSPEIGGYFSGPILFFPAIMAFFMLGWIANAVGRFKRSRLSS